MKKIALTLVLSLIFIGFVNSQTVEIKKLPTTTDEFLKLRDEIATTPEGGAAMFIIALQMYQVNPQIGAECVVISVDRSRLKAGDTYKNFKLFDNDWSRMKRQLAQYPFLPGSYFKKATPQNAYKINLPDVMIFSTNPYSGNVSDGNIKMFVKCGGASSPRPIRMIENNKGLWKASEWSSIIMGIQKPVQTIDDDL